MTARLDGRRDASTAEAAAPGRVWRGEQGEARQANSTSKS